MRTTISTTTRSLVLLAAMTLATPLPVMAQPTPESIVSDAVRDAGHSCEKPAKPVPDPQATTADEKAWLIQCESGRYRVKFMGDQGAKVEPVPGP